MLALLRRTGYVERVVLVVSGAGILVGIPLTFIWFVGGPVLPHLWITARYLLNGVWVVLMYRLQVETSNTRKKERCTRYESRSPGPVARISSPRSASRT